MTWLSRSLVEFVICASAFLALNVDAAYSAEEVESQSPVRGQYWFLCGCYTTKLGHVDGRGKSIGIYTLDSQTGSMRKHGNSPPIVNSSHFCLGPELRFFYSISESYEYQGERDGYLTVFAIDPESKAISQVQTISSAGPGPAYVSLDCSGRYLLLANYVAGNIVVYPIQSDGRLAQPSSEIEHSGSSINRDRQEGPHPHAIVASPDNRFVYVPDLGTDEILAYRFDSATGELRPARQCNVTAPPGSGPRHMVFASSGRWAFVSLELSSEVMSLAYDGGVLTELERHSTVPPDYDGSNTCAEIHVAPDDRYVYVSNRGHDSIAVFRVETESGALNRIAVTSTEGNIPRNFAISHDGRWLVAANQDSHTLVSFRRDPATGQLDSASKINSPSPAYISFID